MKQTRKLFLTTLLACIALNAADNSLGTWKYNLDKSKYDPGPSTVKSLTVTREASDGGVKVTRTGEGQDGTAINNSYTAKYDGKDTPVTGATGGPYDSIAVKHLNANTNTATLKKDGKLYANSRTIISNGGKTMTLTLTGTDAAGKKFHNVVVYDKQ